MEFHRLRLIRSHETTQPYHGVRVRPTLQTSRIPDPSMRRRVRSGRPLAATEWKPLSEKEFEKLLSLVLDWGVETSSREIDEILYRRPARGRKSGASSSIPAPLSASSAH